MFHYAHSLPPPAGVDAWEPLEDHLRRVAEGEGTLLMGASQFAAAFDAAEWGMLLGWWHDLGKYSDEFQHYLLESCGLGDGHRVEIAGRVDHSTAGAKHANSMKGFGRLLAYCIAGHHAGLPDAVGTESSLNLRLEKKICSTAAAPKEVLAMPLPSRPSLTVTPDRQRASFTLGFFTRMLFSCLVDADYLATEWFMSPKQSAMRPAQQLKPDILLARLNVYLQQKQRAAPASPVNVQRSQILEACRAAARGSPGLFSLNVPTGGGKTLSSLAFALSHAAHHGLRRVVYAIPFTSIIEQTAEVFRDALAEHAGAVLEHHSNLDPDDPRRQSARTRLAAENFDSPLVVTTNVQLFESLFASKTSRCRKLHRLAKSVIVLDEAQALPTNLLAPTLAAIEELVTNYGCTIVLCTATQPAIERRDGFPIGLQNVRPIIDKPAELHQGLRRTRVESLGTLSNEDLAVRIREERQALCIVNTRRHAADLLALLQNDPDTLHLSANLCAAHRSDVVAEVRRRLQPDVNAPCRVISTQVIEAGVDVDFPVVFRAAAGLDSIAQAAGRCNREGRLRDANGQPELGRVFVFDYDRKAYKAPPMIEHAAGHFREVLPDHQGDLLAPEAIAAYFQLHYWQLGGENGRDWDRGAGGESVMGCFSELVHYQFRAAAERYRLIDDGQTPIVVPYGERGQDLIETLEQMGEMPDPAELRRFDREAQRYTVSVREHGLRKLLDNGVLLRTVNIQKERYFLGNKAAYDLLSGLSFDAIGLDVDRWIISDV